jgi:hypothetical protein
MIRVKIEVDNELQKILNDLPGFFDERILSETSFAVESVAESIAEHWRAYGVGKKTIQDVDPLKNISRGYIDGIKAKKIGPFNWEVFNKAKNAEIVEYGKPELDMKTTHPYGPKSRVSKDNVPYLIVPFRWKNPDALGFKNVMPQEIYDIVAKFKKMETLVDADKSNYKTPNAKGEMIGRAQYNQDYDQLKMMNTNWNGMVRSTDSTGIDRSGGYFTFRVISAKSPPGSWINPAVPARNVTRGLENYYQRRAEEVITEAFRNDVKRIIK